MRFSTARLLRPGAAVPRGHRPTAAVAGTTTAPDRLTITRPDDWHLHVRDGEVLRDTVPLSAQTFARAVIMPNLPQPVTTVELARQYRARIMAALAGSGHDFQPLMTLYLTDDTPVSAVREAKEAGIHGFKLYPAGATTNSARGVTDLAKCRATLAAMAECGMPLMVHGEVTRPGVDMFDRERVFIAEVLDPLVTALPELRVVMEHITTADAAEYVADSTGPLAATLTPQHLLFNRNSLFEGGLRPHLYCLPVLKRERHRQALLAAATSGSPKFFLGTDSAPHPVEAKESDCGCAGIFSAGTALELYAEAFEAAGALHRLEAFASWHGPDFYGLPRNTGKLTLERVPLTVPKQYTFGKSRVIPLRAGCELAWTCVRT